MRKESEEEEEEEEEESGLYGGRERRDDPRVGGRGGCRTAAGRFSRINS